MYNSYSRFAIFNMLIGGIYALAAIFLVIAICANSAPSELQTATGTVALFRYHEADEFSKQWLDDYSYFNVTFTDDSFFKITGNRSEVFGGKLSSELSVGDTLTVTYLEKGPGAQNVIYGIEYNGITYLEANDSPQPPDQHKKVVIYSIILAVVTVVAILLFVFNYFKNKRKLN